MNATLKITVELENVEKKDQTAEGFSRMMEMVFGKMIPKKHNPRVSTVLEWQDGN